MFTVYILYSKSRDQYYIGQTEDITRRLAQHNAGYSKTTKSGIPWELLYSEEYQSRAEAFRREQELKSKKSHDYIIRLLSGRASR
jgi:putative endonuclease